MIVEPHTFSRTKALLPLYKGAFDQANRVIIAPIFKSRDSHDFGVSEKDIVSVSGHKNIASLDSFEKISHLVSQEAKSGDVVIVMGAGKSHLLSRDILATL